MPYKFSLYNILFSVNENDKSVYLIYNTLTESLYTCKKEEYNLINKNDEKIINIIVEIENIFSISVEAEMLGLDKLKTYMDYEDMVKRYLFI